MISDIIT